MEEWLSRLFFVKVKVLTANSRNNTLCLGKRFQNYLQTYMYVKIFILASIFLRLGMFF